MNGSQDVGKRMSRHSSPPPSNFHTDNRLNPRNHPTIRELSPNPVVTIARVSESSTLKVASWGDGTGRSVSPRASPAREGEPTGSTARSILRAASPGVCGTGTAEGEDMPNVSVCATSGHCQAGGELRLSRLQSRGQHVDIPDGFALVGMRSPQLGSLMVLAVVDKRYLPDDQTGFSLQGFSGNCVGCGRQGFRYFTEFCHHCNMKLATQPKKQKHIRFYINCSPAGVLARGEPILWRAEARRRTSNTPAPNLPRQSTMPQQPDPSQFSLPIRNESSDHDDYDMSPTEEEMEMEVPNNSMTDRSTWSPHKRVKTEEMETNSIYPVVSTVVAAHSMSSKPLQQVVGSANLIALRPSNRSRSTEHIRRPSPTEEINLNKRSSLQLDSFEEVYGRGRGLMPSDSPKVRGRTGSFASASGVTSQSLIVSQPSKQQTVPMSALAVAVSSTPLVAQFGQTALPLQRKFPATPVLLSCQEGASLPASLNPHPICSNLLSGCLDPPKKDHADSNSADALAVSLPSEALALLVVNYFASLHESDLIRREYVDAMIHSARHGEAAWAKQNLKQQHSMLLTHTQLPFLARLTAYASQGRVLVITAASIGEGVEAAMTKLESVRHLPDFVIILQASKYWSIEVGVLVVNPMQARGLAEGNAIDAGVDPETVSRGPIRERQFVHLIAYGIGSLPAGKAPIATIDSYLGDFAKGLASNPSGDAFSPFSEGELNLVHEEDVKKMLGRIGRRMSLTTSYTLYPAQEAVATRVMHRIRSLSDTCPQHLDLSRFQRVDLVIMIPPDLRLYHQTVRRLLQSRLLDELGLLRDDDSVRFETASKHVIKGQYNSEESAKFVRFVARVRSQPSTLFLVVHDVAHLGLGKFEGEAANNVVVDTRLNCKDLLEADNVVALLVTSVPYALQHCNSRVSAENEIHWNDETGQSDTSSQSSVEHDKSPYCGLSECAAVLSCTKQPQFVRQDVEFEDAVSRQCSDVNCHDLSESEIRTALLVRHYVSGMLAAVNPFSMPAEQAPSNATLTVLNDLVLRCNRNLEGRGCAVVIRQPYLRLARFLQKKLMNARDMLGLKFRFEIILDDGISDITLGQHYLEMLRRWRFNFDNITEKNQALNWCPETYEDLEGLPCILIVAGETRLGNTFPWSVKYYDMRCVNMAGCTRAELEQELGVGHSYINVPLPTSLSVKKQRSEDGATRQPIVYLIPRSLYYLLHTPINHVHDKRLLLRPDPHTEWVRHTARRPLSSSDPHFVSAYYRCWTQPAKRHYDYGRTASSTAGEDMSVAVPRQSIKSRDVKDGFHPRRFLLSGPPQIGKTGAYLHLARLLNSTLRSFQEVEVYDEPELHVVRRQHPGLTMSDFPDFRVLFSVPCDLSTGCVSANVAVSPLVWSGARVSMNKGDDVVPDDYDQRRDSEAASVLVSLAASTGSSEISTPTSASTIPCPSGSERSHDVEGSDAMSRRGSGSRERARIRYSDFGRVARKTSLVTMSLPCSYDAFRRAEYLRQCREDSTVASAVQYSVTSRRGSRAVSLGGSRSLHPLQYSLVDGNEVVNLYWHIPLSWEAYFSINDGRQTISSLKLPVASRTGASTEEAASRHVKTPIFIPSAGRYQQGLFNLYYAMNQLPFVAVIVVKLSELNFYACAWPNHIIMALPQSAEQLGLGAARHWIKKFATQNYQVECDRHNCHTASLGGNESTFVWPFFMMLDDSIVMWRKLDSTKEIPTSLADVMTRVEQDPNVTNYALVGFNQWHSGLRLRSRETNFANCQVSHGAVMINLQKTLDINYDKYCYSHSDLDFNVAVGLAGMVICRFEQYLFMRKHIAVGGASNLQLPLIQARRSELDSSEVDVDRLVCAPDGSTSTPVQAPAHFVLETYLSLAGPDLFPDAVGDTSHPVLVPGRFVNLGAKVTVHCLALPITEVTDTVFSGLLLYFNDSRVSAKGLKELKFSKGARLCLIDRDRTTLRQEVARLEMEDSWRLRLRDEFQTANSTGPPLYFLTGSYSP